MDNRMGDAQRDAELLSNGYVASLESTYSVMSVLF